MLRIAIILLALAFAGDAAAQDAIGCDKFKWSVTRERTLLGAASATLKSGETVKDIPGAARVALRRHGEAALPTPVLMRLT